MKIYHIEFAKTGTGISGGEVYMLEIIRYLKSKKMKNILLTTDNGRSTYEKLKLQQDKFLNYQTIKSFYQEKKHHIFISYILRTINAIKLVRNIKINDDDILFCHSDFFPNSIPFYFLAKKNKNAKLFYWFHAKAPNIFRGYEGQFVKTYQFPKPNIIHYRLNQMLYKLLTFERGVILNVNPYHKHFLGKRYFHNFVYTLKKVGTVKISNQYIQTKKIYDLCWMGRFQSLKGLSQLIKIINIIKSKKDNIKVRVLVLGGGHQQFVDRFIDDIKINGLKDNIIYKGFIINEKRFRYITRSKIFLMTSIYENLGTVILEAMKCGLPVAAYNLPSFQIYNKGIVKVPILDNKKFAEEIIKLLDNKEYYKKTSEDALEFSSEFSWEKTGEEIYNLITKN